MTTSQTIAQAGGNFRGSSTRGSNEWIEECDCIVVLGTPRIPEPAIRERLIATGHPSAAGRDMEEWVQWGRDYWSGMTTDSRRVTVKTLAYRDHDWHHAYSSIVKAELVQAVGRGRSLCENGKPVVVVTRESIGLPLLAIPEQLRDEGDEGLLAALLDLSASVSAQVVKSPLSELADNATDLSASSLNCYLSQLADKSAESIPVTTKQLAERLGRKERQVRYDLEKLEVIGDVARVGQRGGWLPASPSCIDLYASVA
jgi:hypothetical protein